MATETIWAGLDPGLSGAVAFIGTTGLGAAVYPMPLRCVDDQDELDSDALVALLESHNPCLVCTERPQGFGGCSASFKLGMNLGGLIVATISARFRLLRVRPQTWQRAILPGVHGRSDLKAASVTLAKSRFPTVRFTKRGRTSDHDIADALLVAMWARDHGGAA